MNTPGDSMIAGVRRSRAFKVALLVAALTAAFTAGRIVDIAAAPVAPDEFVRIGGFRTEIAGLPSDGTDQSWQSVRGGEVVIKTAEVSVGSDRFAGVSLGLSQVNEIVLTSPIGDVGGRRTITEPLQANQFRLEIAGMGGDALASVISVEIDPIVFPAVPLSDQRGGLAQTFIQGAPEFGTMTLQLLRTSAVNDLVDWWDDTIQGNLNEHDVTLWLLDGNGQEVREWTFFRALPVSYAPLGDGIDVTNLPTAAAISMTLDFARAEVFDSTSGQPHHVMQLLNDFVDGSRTELIETLTIVEIDRTGVEGQMFTYHDVFPTRYVFPVLNAGSSETIIDAIYFKANAFSQD